MAFGRFVTSAATVLLLGLCAGALYVAAVPEAWDTVRAWFP